MLLLEMITGRKPNDPKADQFIGEWVSNIFLYLDMWCMGSNSFRAGLHWSGQFRHFSYILRNLA